MDERFSAEALNARFYTPDIIPRLTPKALAVLGAAHPTQGVYGFDVAQTMDELAEAYRTTLPGPSGSGRVFCHANYAADIKTLDKQEKVFARVASEILAVETEEFLLTRNAGDS